MTSLLGMTEVRRRIYQAGIRAAADEARQKRHAERKLLEARIEAATAADEAIADAAALAARVSRPRSIIRAVADKYDLAPADILGGSRVRNVAHARQEVMWEIKQATSLSLTQIGKLLGGRDHSTVIFGVRRHQARLEASAETS